MPFRANGLPSDRLGSWFMAATVVPVLGLVWLGWQTMASDRDVELQRAYDRREQVADIAALALQRRLAETEEQLSSAAADIAAGKWPGLPLAKGITLVALSNEGTVRSAGDRLPYYPIPVPEAIRPPGVFTQADALEIAAGKPAAALDILRPLTRASDASIRAEALLRLARLSRRTGDLPRADEAYRNLGALGDVRVGELPAGLASAQGRALLLELDQPARRSDLAAASASLIGDLDRGRWTLTRAQYDFSRSQAASWTTDAAPPAPQDEGALADAIETVWTRWRSGADFRASRGRQAFNTPFGPALVLWRAMPQGVTVLVLGARALDTTWLAGLRATEQLHHVRVALIDADGKAVVGQPAAPRAQQAVRAPSTTALPWTVHVVSDDTEPSGVSPRAQVVGVAIGLTVLVTVAGAYVIRRALTRELAAARLQSDFVAAVSHEFRTPLTTLRQLSEMLASGRVSSDAKRGQFYESLRDESERLHRLVEGLLDFGRMEAGAQPYHFERVDAVPLVRGVVDAFQRRVEGLGYRVELAVPESDVTISADREAFERVVSNLLDNAVKYSPDARVIWVELAQVDDQLEVRVRDRGMGIPHAEQARIFSRFVRGAGAKTASIGGTGIGLAMCKQIVDAHHGRIHVESAEGEGSTFTVSLPQAT